MEAKHDAYQVVTDKIIALLESGVIPWKKGWADANRQPARSFNTGHHYRGINSLLLNCCAPYSSPYWLTYNQAKDRGGHVRKGEKGWPCVFFKEWETKDKSTGEDVSIPIMKYYTVFNAEQIDGIDFPAVESAPVNPDFQPIARAQEIIVTMPHQPAIIHGHGGKACYMPGQDTVRLPLPEYFFKPEEYYSTAFHELVHSTGHESRLNRRSERKTVHQFGNEEYSREELVAEIGAAFLCHESQIDGATIENSAAYVQGWLKALKNDKKMIAWAAGKAQAAADFILNRKG